MHETHADLFKVLGVESRIKIIELLKQRGTLCVNDMAAALRITSSAVSQHLKVLKHAGLVKNRRKGYWIPYEVDASALQRCLDLLSEVCTCGCGGTRRLREADAARGKNKLRSLREYERELRREICRVQKRITAIKEKIK